MSVLANQVTDYLQRSSWIRKMFEAGMELKAKYGQDKVYDFSLGNPDLPPPTEVKRGLEAITQKADQAYAFGYMPNAGYLEIREKLANYLSEEQSFPVNFEDVLLTCGAAGGLNSLFRAVLEPGEEIICPAPYFVEYYFYARNHGAFLKSVPAQPINFHLDLKAMAEAINTKTRIILINSPNNPTGQIYSRDELSELVNIIRYKEKGQQRPIFLVSDEPYRFLTFDGHEVPSILPLHENSIVVSSFSKNLSLAGERIGYILLNSQMKNKQELMDGLVFTNRILGFVNAPAIGQKLLEYALGAKVDTTIFERRRNLMENILQEAGYTFTPPKGGFYFFIQAPGGDDVEFSHILQEERVLGVPSSGFGFPGYIRLSFCVDENVIINAASSLNKARERAGSA